MQLRVKEFEIKIIGTFVDCGFVCEEAGAGIMLNILNQINELRMGKNIYQIQIIAPIRLFLNVWRESLNICILINIFSFLLSIMF